MTVESGTTNGTLAGAPGDAAGRVAVVTGGGSGIGRATVLYLLAQGYGVVVADINADSIEGTLEQARGAGAAERAVAAHADVRVEGQVASMVATAVERFGRLDVMVNNAALGGAFGPVTDIEADDWDFTFEVVLRGTFFGIKHAARVMTPGASIVNVGSAAAFSGGISATAYAAAKAAVHSLTMSAAVELAPRQIRVNAVCPGVIRTPLLESGARDVLSQPMPPGQPWPRWGQPVDIAGAIAFMAGPGAGFITGQTLVVDGGLVAAGPGPDFQARLGLDPRSRGLVGVNRGMTGQPSEVRRRL